MREMGTIVKLRFPQQRLWSNGDKTWAVQKFSSAFGLVFRVFQSASQIISKPLAKVNQRTYYSNNNKKM